LTMVEEKKDDILSKGAIVQRDYETYAIAPHLTGGLCTPEQLRKLADVAEKHGVKAMKLTSAQRIALVGIPEGEIDNVWADLGMPPGHAIGLCVRSIKFCPGTTFCRRGQQDAVGLGMELDKRYHGYELPSKFKIGVSGCGNSCGESWVKELGFIGMPKGWKVVVGGCAGAQPRIAQELIKDITTEEALDIARKVMDYYKNSGATKRLGKHLETVGFDDLKQKVLG